MTKNPKQKVEKSFHSFAANQISPPLSIIHLH
jgi:hypothetical protein